MKAQAKQLMPFHPNIQSTRREFKLSSHTPAACLVTAECSTFTPSSLRMFVLLVSLLLCLFHRGVTNTVSESLMNPWPKIWGSSSKDHRILAFSFTFLFHFSFDTKLNIAEREGRTSRFHSVLRNSRDSFTGQFMESDELGPNFTNLLSFHFPVTRWRDGCHDLKKPLLIFVFFAILLSQMLDSQKAFSFLPSLEWWLTCLIL